MKIRRSNRSVAEPAPAGSWGRRAATYLALGLASSWGCGGAPKGGSTAPPGGAPAASASTSSFATAQALDSQSSHWSDAESPIPADSDDPTWGDRAAPVTIVVFSDFECPFCARYRVTLARVQAQYGPSKVRLIWKNYPLPFHSHARGAAEVAMGVFELGGNDVFWRFHDMLFERQQQLDPENYLAWAAEAGFQATEELRRGLENRRWGAKVDRDIALSRSLEVDGTPASFVNGVPIGGAQPMSLVQAIIDAELVKAQALLGQGIPADRVYVEATTANVKNAPPKKKEPPAEQEDMTTVWKVPLGTVPSRGPDAALVTIVEFADFECPFCKRVEPTLQRLMETYGTSVRLLFRQAPLPFHPRAEPAAELALWARREKGNAGFWKAHDRLFEMQPDLDDTALEGLAKELGLNPVRAMQAVHEHKLQDQIDADADVMDDLQAFGTPAFFINGRHVRGAQPFEVFRGIVDEEIAKAKALTAKGIPVSDVYAELMKTATDPPSLERKPIALPAGPAPFRGRASAKVVIQEFADFQCPFCARVEPTLNELLKSYDGKVKLVWRNLPLPMHPDASLAAEAALEAFQQKGQEGFWRMHDRLYENQSTPDGLKEPALLHYAEDIGLDKRAFQAALEGHVHAAEVEADSKTAADAKVLGTPGFVINGYFISGAQPIAKFRKTIRRALVESGSASASSPPSLKHGFHN